MDKKETARRILNTLDAPPEDVAWARGILGTGGDPVVPLTPAPKPSFLGDAAGALARAPLDILGMAARTADYALAAPVRAGVSKLLEGKPLGALGRFATQYGKAPETAPTTEDIAGQLGAGDRPIFGDVKNPLLNKFNATPRQVLGGALNPLMDLGTLAAGAGPIAKMAGTAAGAIAPAAGRTAVKMAEMATGSNLPARLAGAASGAASGVADVARAFNPLTVYPGKPLADAPRFQKLAEIIGLENTANPAIIAGKNSEAFKAYQVSAEGPGGESLRLAHNTDVRKIEDAIQGQIIDIGGGTILKPETAGKTLIDGIYGFEKTIPEKDMINEALKNIPPIPDRGIIEALVNAKVKNPVGSAKQANVKIDEMVQDIINLREGNKGFDVIPAADYRMLRMQFDKEIGDSFGKESSRYIEALKSARARMRMDLEDAAKASGEPQYVQAMESYAKKLKDIETIEIRMGAETSPDKIFEKLIGNSNAESIQALKNILSPEDLKVLKSTWLDGLVKEGADGSLQFGSLNAALQSKKNQAVLRNLFEPGEVDYLQDFLALRERIGNPFLSTSGTAASEARMPGLRMLNDLASGAFAGARTGAQKATGLDALGSERFAPNIRKLIPAAIRTGTGTGQTQYGY